MNNLERVADHCSNIAVALLEEADTHLQSHKYLRTFKTENREEYQRQIDLCAKKYYDALNAIEAVAEIK